MLGARKVSETCRSCGQKRGKRNIGVEISDINGNKDGVGK